MLRRGAMVVWLAGFAWRTHLATGGPTLVNLVGLAGFAWRTHPTAGVSSLLLDLRMAGDRDCGV